MFELTCAAGFEAAHHMPHAHGEEAYRRMHGHSYLVTVTIASERADPEAGWIMDFAAFEAAVQRVAARLDHRVLNDIEGLATPTFENLLLWLDAALRAEGLSPARIEIARPTLRQSAVYRPSAATGAK